MASAPARGLGPGIQVRVRTRIGVFRVDLGWPAERLALEFDGFVKYAGGGAGSATEVVVAEKRRQDAIEEEGWRVLRITWTDLRSPAALAHRVARVLAARPREVGRS